MVKCNWCDKEEPYFELRQNEHSGKWNIWDNNLGLFHSCPQNKQQQREKEDYEARKQLIEHNKMMFSIPVYCNTCGKSFPALEPCSHIVADGYITGKDNASFYANTKQAEEKRKLIKKQMQRKKEIESLKNKPKKFSPQRKLF